MTLRARINRNRNESLPRPVKDIAWQAQIHTSLAALRGAIAD